MRHENRPILAKTCGFLALAVLAIGCASDEGTAQGQASVLASPHTDLSAAAEKAELALRLARQARADGDPRAMVVAMRLMMTSGTRPAALQGNQVAIALDGDPIISRWGEEALVLAGGDDALTSEIIALMKMKPRGILGSSFGAGPLRYVQRLSTGEALAVDIQTEAGAAARVAAIGDGDARIGLDVSAGPQKVCQGEGARTHSVCAWRAEIATHAVQLRNLGPLDSDVMLLSN